MADLFEAESASDILLGQIMHNQRDTLTELRGINKNLADQGERLAKLEANPVKALEDRVLQLENELQRRRGASNLLAWLKDYTPWIIIMMGGAYAYFTKRASP